MFLSLANFFSTKSFGEFEFWFSLVKVVAIIGFIIIGILAISGIWPLAKNVSGVANLYNNAGFMPHGMGGILSAILITAFSFFGVEIVSIAAAESSNPKQKIKRATNLVLYRIILFFVVSMFIAVFSSTFIGLVCCVINYVFPGKVFGLLLSSTGSIALLVYLVIAFSQLRLRHKLEAAGAEIPFKMWLFPWLTWFVIIIILSVLAYMFFSPAYSYETTLSLGVTLGVVVCGLFVTRKRKATRPVAINQSNL